MECPKCSASADEGTLFCPQCGARFQLDPTEGNVMSMEEWKLKKFREKNEARKEKTQVNRPKYEDIHERMLTEQADSDVEVIEKALEEKKNEKTVTELQKITMETEPLSDENTVTEEAGEEEPPGEYNNLFDFETVAGEIKADKKKTEEKKKQQAEVEPEKTEEEPPKKRRRRRKVVTPATD